MTHTNDEGAKYLSVCADRAARRALILAATVCRATIDAAAGEPDAKSLHRRVCDWLTSLDLWDAVEPSEEKILRAPLGQLDPEIAIRATWNAEGLAILAWALNRLELPRHDEKVDPYSVADSLGFLNEDARDVISTAKLRNSTELEACREFLYAIHCRLRDFIRNGGGKDFTRWVDNTWLATLGLNASQLIAHNDLAIDGRAINDIGPSRVQECEWITRERHRAAIWLLGEYPLYSETPVDT